MKLSRKLTSLVLSAALVVGTSVTAFAATPNEDVLKALKDAKVPATYLIQAENYLKTNTVTAEEAAAVKTQVSTVEQVVKAAGVTDVTKLSDADKTKVLTAVKEAGKAVDLVVNVQKQSNGQLEVVAKDETGKVVASFTSNEVKQTGFDSTVIYAGALMIILAAGSVFVLRRNGVKA
jgi:hypothetical protein